VRNKRKGKRRERKRSSRGGISPSETERSRRYREVQRRLHLVRGPIYRRALSFTRAHWSHWCQSYIGVCIPIYNI
jgi:hypothetical protein